MTSAGAVASAAWLRDWRAAALLFAVGLAVLAPEFLTGPSTSDSLRYNIVWLDQWRELVAGGNLYPRWLPRAWDGLGSPAFYFYPPLFFWLAVALDQLTLRVLDTGALLSLTSALLLGTSGLAMRSWLRAHVNAGTAMLGALAYMLAPYHIYDIFARAALAETCTFAVLPLVMLAMKRAGQGSAFAYPLLSVAYAALVMSHLPVALLASVVLLPSYALFLTRYPALLARIAAAGLLGAGLAAIYLVPALALTDTILAEALSTSFFRPENWFFWRSGIFLHPIIWIVVLACTAAALLALSSLRAIRERAGQGQVRFWAIMTIVMVLLVAGFPPAFWNLPAISLVQFPWRLMVLVEFAVVTAVAISVPHVTKSLATLAAIFLIIASCLVVVIAAQQLGISHDRSDADIRAIRETYRDAPEYLPAGYTLPPGSDAVPNPATIEYPPVPLVQVGAGARASARSLKNGEMIVDVMSASSVRVVARRFAHGPWVVSDASGRVVRVSTTPDFLIGWSAPAGRSKFHVRLGTPMAAIYGRLVSALSLLGLLVLFARATRGRQRRSTRLEMRP